jgi:hypothetical protein
MEIPLLGPANEIPNLACEVAILPVWGHSCPSPSTLILILILIEKDRTFSRADFALSS